MTERFTLAHGNTTRYWTNVVVYDTTDEMRAAALKHRPTSDPASLADSGGCFQVANSSHPNYLGIIRLSREYLTPEAIIHEAVHCALSYVQKTQDVNRLHLDAWSDGRRAIDNEEELAYAVHGIATALLTELGLVS